MNINKQVSEAVAALPLSATDLALSLLRAHAAARRWRARDVDTG
jgi:hypothetical protein